MCMDLYTDGFSYEDICNEDDARYFVQKSIKLSRAKTIRAMELLHHIELYEEIFRVNSIYTDETFTELSKYDKESIINVNIGLYILIKYLKKEAQLILKHQPKTSKKYKKKSAIRQQSFDNIRTEVDV